MPSYAALFECVDNSMPFFAPLPHLTHTRAMMSYTALFERIDDGVHLIAPLHVPGHGVHVVSRRSAQVGGVPHVHGDERPAPVGCQHHGTGAGTVGFARPSLLQGTGAL